ncbi:MAG: Heptaprenyl diphosphate synthase component 2 [Candidatus Dichloromethanomonas elyunquensis]|nr:MAG: Heptaprenyl diphosphate synthase component 2 [Candidatus Dichloromethanomonas elyunquensis]
MGLMADLKQLGIYTHIHAELQALETELLEFVATDFSVLHEPSIHLLKAGGKRLRPAMAFLSAKFYKPDPEKLMFAAMALELLHMASLVHDDVVDESVTRRGCPTVKAQWGNIVAIQTGDYLFAKVLELLAKIGDPAISKILAQATVEMCKGEIKQIKTVHDTQLSFQQYYYRIKQKTAILLKASCYLGGIAGGAPKKETWALGAYGHALGIAFQISDDILDITGEASELGKQTGGDIRQGVMTLPMILALKLSPRSQELYQILNKQAKSEWDVDLARSLIRESGAIQASGRWVNLFVDKAMKYLEYLSIIKTKQALGELAGFIRIRKW